MITTCKCKNSNLLPKHPFAFLRPDGPKDITLPDGTVRHNVGSDNLSDEDRRGMDRQLQDWLDAGMPDSETPI